MQPENQQANWNFKTEQAGAEPLSDQPAPRTPQPEQVVTWTGSEFIAHHKDGRWYSTMGAGFIVFCGLVYLITRDIISVIAIGLVIILFFIISAKKPEQRTYTLTNQGIAIDKNFYPYDLFKSFALRYEGAIGSVSFMPLQRFMPELAIYFAPDDEERIVSVLAANLPNDQRKEQGVDRLMKRLRF